MLIPLPVGKKKILQTPWSYKTLFITQKPTASLSGKEQSIAVVQREAPIETKAKAVELNSRDAVLTQYHPNKSTNCSWTETRKSHRDSSGVFSQIDSRTLDQSGSKQVASPPPEVSGNKLQLPVYLTELVTSQKNRVLLPNVIFLPHRHQMVAIKGINRINEKD